MMAIWRKSLTLFVLVVSIVALLGCCLPANALQRRAGPTPTAAVAMESTVQTPERQAAERAVTATPKPTPTTEAARQSAQQTPEPPAATVAPELLTEEQIVDAVEAMTIRVYEKVSPSVVHITSRVITMDFWGGLYPAEGTGSGFIIDKEGHIVTNNHVVEGAENIEVTLYDGTVAQATVVGLDPFNDLAVLRIEVDPDKLHPVDMSFDGQLKVGQRAIAIGNPYGLDWTLTEGVISALGRPLQFSQDRIIYDTIQTDAAINPGNSGGPLLNSRGQLIGVTSAVRSGAENIGFAIPLSTLRRVIPELIENGRYRHPWLGIAGYTLSEELAQRLGLPVTKGILIARVYADSPAVEAGLKGATREIVLGNTRLYVGGDILVEINGVPIDSNEALREFLETRTRVGEQVEIKFYRGDKLMTSRATLTERQQ